jgi:hypothetical protein
VFHNLNWTKLCAVLCINFILYIVLFIKLIKLKYWLKIGGLPTHRQHIDDTCTDDKITSQGIVAHTTYPVSAVIRGEPYYLITPRVRVPSPSPTHSRSGSSESQVDIPPYPSTDGFPVMTQIDTKPPAYDDIPSMTTVVKESDKL